MWKLKTNKRCSKSAEVNRSKQLPGRRLTDQLKVRLGKWKVLVLNCLERIDNCLTNRQRKWLFYLGLLCWSGFLFYLLGMAIRTPPSAFVLPFAADSSQPSLKHSK